MYICMSELKFVASLNFSYTVRQLNVHFALLNMSHISAHVPPLWEACCMTANSDTVTATTTTTNNNNNNDNDKWLMKQKGTDFHLPTVTPKKAHATAEAVTSDSRRSKPLNILLFI